MALRLVCDRCGAEINPTSSVTYCRVGKHKHPEPHDDDLRTVELCCSCALWLRRYLDGEASVLRQEEGVTNA